MAASVGGPFVPALERLAKKVDTPLPLAELADAIPYGHAALRNLALIAARRAATGPGSADAADQAMQAASLNKLAIRQSEVGTGPRRWPPPGRRWSCSGGWPRPTRGR